MLAIRIFNYKFVNISYVVDGWILMEFRDSYYGDSGKYVSLIPNKLFKDYKHRVKEY